MKDIRILTKKLLFRIGNEVANIAKEKSAPIVTGNLKKDIKPRNITSTSVEVGNTLKAKYAKFVHYGTKPYTIKPKNKKALANKAAGLFFGKKVNHPGIKANPYLNRAVDEYKQSGGLDRAVKSFAQELKEEIVQDIKITLKE